MLEVTKCSPQLAIMQLGNAFKRFFKGESKYPQFRKKGEKWFVSITVELSDVFLAKEKTGQSVGLDLGITDLATLSDGTKIQAPKPLKNKLKKLQRLNKSLSRKQKGSKNRTKAKTKLSRLHYQIGCIRKDFLHKLTTYLINTYDTIAIEDLNVKDMVKNKKLARSINDLGFYELKRQLIYKVNQWGKIIKSVDRFFASSKTCSCCGQKVETLSLSIRTWTCQNCNTTYDRDINASINILTHATKVLTIT